MLRQVPKFLTDPLGPLSIRPAYLPKLLPWLARFVLASRPGPTSARSRGSRRCSDWPCRPGWPVPGSWGSAI